MLKTHVNAVHAYIQNHDEISIRDIVKIIEDDAHLIILIILSLLNIVLAPLPINSFIIGIPLIIVSCLYLFDWDADKLGNRIMSKQFKCVKWRPYVSKMAVYIDRFQKITVANRLPLLSKFEMRFISGLSLLILSLIIFLPIPFANIPGSIGTIFLCIGLLQRDGLFLLIGYLILAIHIIGMILLKNLVISGFEFIF
jgi:hypothetical protein